MAKIQEELIVVKFSQLVKDGEHATPRITDDVTAALVQVAEEVVGTGVIVEIERA